MPWETLNRLIEERNKSEKNTENLFGKVLLSSISKVKLHKSHSDKTQMGQRLLVSMYIP